MTSPTVILASTSRYRANLLKQIGVLFSQVAPGVDETARPDEAPAQLASRLAEAKARAAAEAVSGALVIGSDQVASIDGAQLGKPGTVERARGQLRRSRGKSVEFHTAVSVITPDGNSQIHVDSTTARFRHLSDAEIERYLDREPALDCAGSFRVEGLGITLFDGVDSSDPTALVGLPLIAVARMLREAGVALP